MATSAVKVGEKVNVPAKQQEAPTVTMKDWINKSQYAISKALPSAITPGRFSRMATTAVTMNPDLGKCTPSSFIGAMLQAGDTDRARNVILKPGAPAFISSARQKSPCFITKTGTMPMKEGACRQNTIRLQALCLSTSFMQESSLLLCARR